MLIVSEKLFNKDLMRELNSELRNSQISQQEKAQENFIQYFKKVIGIRHKKSSKSIIINWHRTGREFLPIGIGELLYLKGFCFMVISFIFFEFKLIPCQSFLCLYEVLRKSLQ